MFDFHRHFTQSKSIESALYATSALTEWDNIAPYISYGLLANNFNVTIDEFKIILENKLKQNPLAHIGEIGLDSRFDNMDQQIKFFQVAIDLAFNYERILTIHIVNSNQLLIDILKDNKNHLPTHIIYHGYNKSVDFAKQLKKYNITVSINPKVEKTKLIKNIKQLDKIGFLLESDWDCETDDNYKLYFESFTTKIEALGASRYKDINNEFRTILKNF